MTTHLTIKDDKFIKFKSVLEKSKQALSSCIPTQAQFDVNRFLSVIIGEVKKCPKLLDCTPTSLFGAIMYAARLGLEPDFQLGHFYILPYKDRAQVIIGYRGLLQLAMRSNDLKMIYAQVVYEGDEFGVELGDTPKLFHRPNLSPKIVDNKIIKKEVVAAYSVAHYINGEKAIEIMSKSDIDYVRSKSQNANSMPWANHYDSMARKTVLRRMCKYIPNAIDVQRAACQEEAMEVEAEKIEDYLDVDLIKVEEDNNEQVKSITSSLTNKLNNRD